MSDSVKTQILGFIRSRYPQADLGSSDDIFAVGFVNSLFAMELVMYIEKTFGVTIPNDELQIGNFRTADAMTDLVGRLTSVPESVGV